MLARIRHHRDLLPKAERGIADLVLADPGAAATRTITELARAAGTSETTVHRFCRSLDLRGYAQLRLGLAAEPNGCAPTPAPTSASAPTSAPTTPRATGPQGRLGQRPGRRGDRHRPRARRILVVGVGSSALAALDATQKLQRLGYAAVFASDVHAALMTAASGTRRPRPRHQPLRPGPRGGRGAGGGPPRPGRHRRRHQQPALARRPGRRPGAAHRRSETAFRSGGTASRTAQLTVVDALYVTLAQHDHARILDGLERAHDAVRRHSLRRAR
nr:MurR/RpiR family transcriptional regulator [Kitasatospora fiedleri]